MNPKRKIVLLSFLEPWSMGYGIGAPSLYETLKGYARAGWQVEYITFEKRHVLGGAHEKNVPINIPGVTVHRFTIPTPFIKILGARFQAKADRLFLFTLFALRKVVEIIRITKPNVIYAYEASGIITALVLRLIFRQPKFLYINRIQGVSVLGESYQRLPFMVRKLETLLSLYLKADLYIMTNDGTKGDDVWTYWNNSITVNNLLFIRNGIDKDIYIPDMNRSEVLTQAGLDPDCLYLVMVSRLDPIKRIERGLFLLKYIVDLKPNVRLLILGDGEDKLRLENIADELGITKQIEFLGALSRPVVANIMNIADIFLSLYDFSNCGNPLFEALLCGRPIVTLANGATPDVITDSINGRLLHPDDVVGLRCAVLELIVDSKARLQISVGARNWAEANMYSWEQRLRREINWVEKKLNIQ